jgi:hypothetical protein
MHDVIFETVNYSIDYAERHKMRLLVEIEPDYKRLFVYCDDFNITDFVEIFRNIEVKVIYKTTDIFYKYEYYPKCIMLDHSKGKWQYRFYKRYEVDLVETKDKDYYFVERNIKFDKNEKDHIIDVVKDIDFKSNDLESIYESMLNAKILEDLEVNLFNDFGVIFYK